MAKKRGKELFYSVFTKENIPTDEEMSKFFAVEEVLMTGYPIGLWDKRHNLPLTRAGITATHPNVNYNGREEFVIDVAVFPGSSGSPVVQYNRGAIYQNSGITFGERFKLIGIAYAIPEYTSKGEVEVVKIPTEVKPDKVNMPTNLGYIIKAKKILDFEKMIMK